VEAGLIFSASVERQQAGFACHGSFDFFAQQHAVGIEVVRVDFEFCHADDGAV
jgi:hypothetical protein